MAEIAKAWGNDPGMMKHFEKKLSGVYELTNGKLFAYDKPELKTRFCFGYGYCATSTDEEEREADRMAEHAATHEDYFIKENLKGINGLIAMVQTGRPANSYDWETYTLKLAPVQYCGTPALNVRRPIATKEGERLDHYGDRLAQPISEADRVLILAALNNEREKLIKRLNTYLKRHGMSKVKTWSYILD